jgi:hypothetical protein
MCLFLFLAKFRLSVQVSGVRDQSTDNRKQRTDKLFHLTVFTTCLLISVLCFLTPETK